MNKKIAKNSKKKRQLTERMKKTLALVREGYSLRRAMIEAGYSVTTAQKKASEYLRRLDLDELRKGLKIQTALSSFKALKVLDQKMEEAEKDSDQIKAADAVLRSGKTYLTSDPGDTTIVFQLQTIKGEKVFLNSPAKLDAIDINSEEDEEDKS